MSFPTSSLFPAALLLALAALSGCATHTASLGSATAVGASSSADGYVASIRTSHGLGALTPDPALERAALEQARLMARSGRMSHGTGWGNGFSSRMKKNGINGVAAENLARGRMETGKVFSMWMNSAGHRRNMLDPRLRRFGLAHATEPGSERRYWALIVAD